MKSRLAKFKLAAFSMKLVPLGIMKFQIEGSLIPLATTLIGVRGVTGDTFIGPHDAKIYQSLEYP